MDYAAEMERLNELEELTGRSYAREKTALRESMRDPDAERDAQQDRDIDA